MADKEDFFSRGAGYNVVFPQVEPTNTSNPGRPRTEAAGYDPSSKILKVRFRSGAAAGGTTAVYEYYSVPPSIWAAFKVTESPGKFINRVLNQFDYERVV